MFKIKFLIKYIYLLISIFYLSACGIIKPYTTPVQQGRHIKNDKLLLIKPYMTKKEVISILGSPDIIDSFNPYEFIYINSYKKNIQSNQLNELKLILTFNRKNKLVNISGNYIPPSKKVVF